MKKQIDDKFSRVIELIKEKPYLVWYVKNIDNLSKESAVESILNWGDFEDVQELIKILGIQEVSKIFQNQISAKRNNYKPEIKNYFQLYFDKYAS